MIINLLPVGKISSELIEEIANFIQERITVDVKIKDKLTLGVKMDETRGQYNAIHILEILLNFFEPDKLLGVCDVDIFVPGMNFVFGVVNGIGGEVGIVSITRLRQEFYGLPEDLEIFKSRVRKEVLHELGHLIGLSHCPDPSCVMHFSNSLMDTDYKKDKLCDICNEKIKQILKYLN